MVSVPKDQKTLISGDGSYMEFVRGDYEARDEGIEAVAQEEVPVEIYKRPNRFNLFRKKQPAVSLESVSFVRVASAQPSERDETSMVNSVEL